MRYLAFLLLLSSCFPLTSYSLNKIKVGDSRSKVVKDLGRPSYHMEYYTKEHLVYYVHDDIFSLFYSSKFPFVGFYPFLRTGDEYWVIIDGGKIVSHARAKDYRGGISRALNGGGDVIEAEVR
jgi:outer membrane protein assembly factor BamE (lipoprotein component of BamABCDE complex)